MNSQKQLLYFIPLVLICVYIVSLFTNLRIAGFTAHSPLYTRLTYMFVHIGFLHLVINIMSFYQLFRTLTVRINQYILSVAMIVGAMLATIGSEQALPTVGASGMVAFMLGCLAVSVSSKKIWISVAIIAAVCVLQSFFFPVNNAVHLLAFIYGAVFGIARRIWIYTSKKKSAEKIIQSSVEKGKIIVKKRTKKQSEARAKHYAKIRSQRNKK